MPSIESTRLKAFERLLAFPRFHLATYVHRTADNKILDFVANEWQQKIYKSNYDRIVIKKSSKVGISELLIADVMIQAKMGLNGMYVLPDSPIRNRFVTSRLDKIIGNTPEYNANVSLHKKSVDSKSLKSIYGRTWAIVGAANPGTFYEFNSDINIYDEYDKCNVLSIETATDRTLASDKDRWRKVGNPTISGMGISEEYDKSNQNTWMIKCSHCNEWQELEWFSQFVRQEDKHIFTLKDTDSLTHDNDANGLCNKCDRDINRLSRGQWVVKHPDIPIEGFAVTRLFGNIAKSRNIVKEDFSKMLDCIGDLSLTQWFFNNRLGISYEADGSKVTPALLAECVLSNYIMPAGISEGTIVAGADVGSKIHITASICLPDGERKKVLIDSIPLDLDIFEATCRKYKIRHGVIDALPETNFVKQFIQRNPGWYRCYYGLKDETNINIKLDHKNKKINIGRTEALDASLANYTLNKIHIPANFMSIDKGDFVKQMCIPTRVYDDVKQVFIWTKGVDHYRHADSYENIAFSHLYPGGGSLVS